MDVPLALNDIGIQKGLKRYKRKSSTFSSKTDVVGLSALYMSRICFFSDRIIFGEIIEMIDFGNFLTH